MPLPLVIGALAKLGLPLLMNVVSDGLGKVNHPAAKAASKALVTVKEAVSNGDISSEQVAEANRHTEQILKTEAERDTSFMSEVNQTMRSESASNDNFTKRWRPFFGYIVALTWGAQMLALSWSIIFDPRNAPQILAGVGALSAMWGIALAVLGVSVHRRSHDKQVAAGHAPTKGVIAAFAERIGR
jgi:uncharacterized membrane protein YdfJ with MMPL/SSD domain